MKTLMTITSLVVLLVSACGPSINKRITGSNPGEAIIQYQNGKYSATMTTREGFDQLKSNEKLYLSPGRVELSEPLEIENLENIQIIGNNTSLVAKIDMPVLTFYKTNTLRIYDLLVVHEIGEWCAQNCVELNDVSDVEIKKCKMDGSGYFGLALTNTHRAVIENNQFFNCEFGLAAWQSSNLVVKNNRFNKNRDQDIMVNDEAQFSNDFRSDNTFE